MASASGKGNVPIDSANVKKQEIRIAIVKYPSMQLKLIENGLGCVRCSDVPNPSYYLVCKDNGHIFCGNCAWISPQEDERVPEDPDPASCCDAGNLIKGSAKVLEGLINSMLWECPYVKYGCDKRSAGNEWLGHIKSCASACTK